LPESLRTAFHSFSDITDPGTYSTPNVTTLPQSDVQTLDVPVTLFTEWWRIGEGEKLREPFDVRDELVAGLLRILDVVSDFFYLQVF
jgi:hypothetical protein